ncbi:MAG: class I SAM-dependent RNA methyltransferase [Mycobacteriales bacterium]|nr:MAG: hypothetical protein DLM56_09375 [Pseudonocardiales bacterium]
MTELELEVGPPAHGGHCVARHDGRVVFVRHALPGELVTARIVDEGAGVLRADAIAVVRASADRVPPPCPHAGPGRCGGCDWQHVEPAAQLALKAEVVRDTLRRIGGLSDVDVVVEPLPGGPLHWRTRTQFAVDRRGRLGLRRHRSHTVEPIESCPLLVPAADDAVRAVRQRPPGATVEVAVSADGETVVDVRARRRRSTSTELLHERALGRRWQVHAGVFWQVHPAAADTLARAVVDMCAASAGERMLDLYAGVGLFSWALAREVGPAGSVVAVENDDTACADARVNLVAEPWARVVTADVDADMVAAHPADVVVLDPPRAGAGAAVLTAIAQSGPRAICYVSCDPATLARDLRAATAAGYRLGALRAFDIFPMTQHVECVALLHRS